MITNIIQFPADRCRPPASAIEAAELMTFDRAATRYAADCGHADSVTAMMRLALQGACAAPRAQAAAWLHKHCSLLIR